MWNSSSSSSLSSNYLSSSSLSFSSSHSPNISNSQSSLYHTLVSADVPIKVKDLVGHENEKHSEAENTVPTCLDLDQYNVRQCSSVAAGSSATVLNAVGEGYSNISNENSSLSRKKYRENDEDMIVDNVDDIFMARHNDAERPRARKQRRSRKNRNQPMHSNLIQSECPPIEEHHLRNTPSSASSSSSALSGGEEKKEEEKKIETDCCICLENCLLNGCIDPCKHTFCFKCIKKWSKVNNTCPICRAVFKEIKRIGLDGKVEETIKVEPIHLQEQEAQTIHTTPSEREIMIIFEPGLQEIMYELDENNMENLDEEVQLPSELLEDITFSE